MTQNFIDEVAQKVLSVYNITIPITNIEEIVERMGGKIEEKFNFDDLCDGTICKNSINSFQIAIVPFQNPQRKKFTVARELGHLFLHMGFKTNNQLWNQQSKAIYRKFKLPEQEYQALEFAASLLMPKNIYKEILYKTANGNIANILEVADYFKVSVAAATNRGRLLGYLYE